MMVSSIKYISNEKVIGFAKSQKKIKNTKKVWQKVEKIFQRLLHIEITKEF